MEPLSPGEDLHHAVGSAVQDSDSESLDEVCATNCNNSGNQPSDGKLRPSRSICDSESDSGDGSGIDRLPGQLEYRVIGSHRLCNSDHGGRCDNLSERQSGTPESGGNLPVRQLPEVPVDGIDLDCIGNSPVGQLPEVPVDGIDLISISNSPVRQLPEVPVNGSVYSEISEASCTYDVNPSSLVMTD